MSTKTQCDLILAELKQGKSLTAMDAMNMGIMRLAARIHDLRDTHNIVSERVTSESGARFARYSLVREVAA